MLRLERWWSQADFVIGNLYVADAWECYSKERPASEIYVAGETAVPAGHYNVSLTRSRSGRELPLLVQTSGPGTRIGTRFHTGHPDVREFGHILLGQSQLARSIERTRLAHDALLEKIVAAIRVGSAVDLEIVDAPLSTVGVTA